MAKTKHDSQWAKAKHVCRLNLEDIRMAKELGISPQSLIKNRPSPSQPWKQPVKDWIGELYEKRFGRKTSAPDREQSTERTLPARNANPVGHIMHHHHHQPKNHTFKR